MAEKRPKYSVIIPAFNEERALARALEALARSSFQDFEAIVVSDASTDATDDLARRAGVRLVRHEYRRGPAAARNTGAAAASAEFLVFLDADVVPELDWLQRLDQQLTLRPDIRCFSGVYADEPASEGWFQRYRALLSYYYVADLPSCSASTLLVTAVSGLERSLFEAVGGFDETANAAHAEDTELGYRLGQLTQLYLLRDVRVRHEFPGLGVTFNNYFRRSAAWVRLFGRRRRFDNHTTTGRTALLRLVGAATALSHLLLLVAPRYWPVCLGAHVGYCLSNRRFVGFVARRAPVAELPLMYVADLSLGLAVLAGAGAGAASVLASALGIRARLGSSFRT